jgi:hypothetical protein
MLQEDPDEDGRAQAVVCAKLPEVYPDDEVQASMRRYHERLIAELPLFYCPLFALVIAFVSKRACSGASSRTRPAGSGDSRRRKLTSQRSGS